MKARMRVAEVTDLAGGSLAVGTAAGQPTFICCTPATYIWDPVPQMWAESKATKRPSRLQRGIRPARACVGPSQSFDEK